jgi:hypothetical protein
MRLAAPPAPPVVSGGRHASVLLDDSYGRFGTPARQGTTHGRRVRAGCLEAVLPAGCAACACAGLLCCVALCSQECQLQR